MGSPPRASPAGTSPILGVGQHVALKVLEGLSTVLLRSGAALGSTDLPRGTFPHIQGPRDAGMPFPRLFPPCVGDEKGIFVGPRFLFFAWPALHQSAPSRQSKVHSAAHTAPRQWLVGILAPRLGCAAAGHTLRRGNLPNLGEKNECWCPWEPRAPAVDGRWAPGWPWPSLSPLPWPL